MFPSKDTPRIQESQIIWVGHIICQLVDKQKAFPMEQTKPSGYYPSVTIGGLGTVPRSLLMICPKPMAPVNREPFLYYIFKYLVKQHISEAGTFSVGYMHEIVKEFFRDVHLGVIFIIR